MSRDKINPDHYKSNGIEVIDIIEQYTYYTRGVLATDTGNVIKYILRHRHKNGIEDLRKAEWYLNHIIKSLEKSNTYNRLCPFDHIDKPINIEDIIKAFVVNIDNEDVAITFEELIRNIFHHASTKKNNAVSIVKTAIKNINKLIDIYEENGGM